MSSPPSSRPNFTSIVAACILSGGLIASAIINSRKPAPIVAPSGVVVSAEGRAVLPTPPISKESMTAQVTAQLMASPQLKTIKDDGYDSPLEKSEGSVCRLTGVAVNQVKYAAKEDQFGALLNETFQSASGTVITHTSYLSLENDGYGTYVTTYYLPETVNVTTGAVPEVHLAVH